MWSVILVLNVQTIEVEEGGSKTHKTKRVVTVVMCVRTTGRIVEDDAKLDWRDL